MKNIIIAIAALISAGFKKITGKSNLVVTLPEDVAITPEVIDHCINTVNIIKKVVDNPVTILLTDLTPIQLDNEIRLKIADAIPAVLAGLTYSKEYLTANDKVSAVNGILAKVRLSDDADKDALYHALAARLIMIASDGKVSWSEAVSLLEVYFKQVFTLKN